MMLKHDAPAAPGGSAATLAGRVLALLDDPACAGHDHIVVHAAALCAVIGIERALGWADGWWYNAGNSQDGNNATWRAIRACLGAPVPD